MQTKTQNVYQHGIAVWEQTKKILAGELKDMRLPDWFVENHRHIVNNIHRIDIVQAYNIYHDCGKPYCVTYDDRGGKHFTDHANFSKLTWETAFGTSDEDANIVSNLIGQDMLLHTIKAVELEAILGKLDKRTAYTLLVTAFAELHANATMFGGIQSTSFKIKYKQIAKRGKQILTRFQENVEHPYSYVIVRKDLPAAQKAIQGTHAVIEHFKANQYDFHPSLVYVVVKNETKLKAVLQKLQEDNIHCSIFRDDLFDNSITAICTEPLKEDWRRQYLKRFMLLNESTI